MSNNSVRLIGVAKLLTVFTGSQKEPLTQKSINLFEDEAVKLLSQEENLKESVDISDLEPSLGIKMKLETLWFGSIKDLPREKQLYSNEEWTYLSQGQSLDRFSLPGSSENNFGNKLLSNAIRETFSSYERPFWDLVARHYLERDSKLLNFFSWKPIKSSSLFKPEFLDTTQLSKTFEWDKLTEEQLQLNIKKLFDNLLFAQVEYPGIYVKLSNQQTGEIITLFVPCGIFLGYP